MENTLKSNPDIAQEFAHCYTDLYNLSASETQTLNPISRFTLIQSFLEKHCPRPLTSNTSEELDRSITTLEWVAATKNVKPGKSPGPDSLPAVYYKTFSDILSAPFLKAFNPLSAETPLSSGLLEAHISVIPKEGKDPTQTANYRPISLLNLDIKMFTKSKPIAYSLYSPPSLPMTKWALSVGGKPGII